MSVLKDKVNHLVMKIKKGDTNSFQILHEITFNHLKIVAYNYLFDSSEIDDVLNESYFRIFQYVDTADTNKDCYNWMCKIVQNIAYQHNKKHNVTDDINKAETQNLFYELDDKIIEDTDILRAIKTLNREEQQLIYFKYWEDLAFSEIAVLIKSKKSTIYKKVRIALKKIKEILKNG